MRSATIIFLAVATAACATAFGQTGNAAVTVTVGMPPPVVGKPFTVYTLVTNPASNPVPAGSVQFDFGDGTPTVSVPMSYRVAAATHTYSTVGPAKVTATYSGDSNFAPVSATLQGQVVRSVPAATLNVFGDSISYGSNDVAFSGQIWNNVAYIEQWSLNNLALPGYKVADETPAAYSTKIAPDSYSAVLLGQNDFNFSSQTVPAYITQYQSSLLAVSTWLLIPDTDARGTHPKAVAQDPSVARSGTWIASSLYPTMGLSTTQAGDSLTSIVRGSTVYVGVSGTTASNFTIDVYVDGSLSTEYSPSIVYSGGTTGSIPLGIRIPVLDSALSDSHTVSVVCKEPGSSGCFVDWFAGNDFSEPNKLPLLWLGEPYHSNQTGWTYAYMLPYIAAIREIGQNLQADGLGITLADVFDNFDGQLEPQCLVDTIHPAECGRAIVAATFTGAMSWLFTKDQRIDFGMRSTANFSTALIPVDVSATSNLPVALSVLSGPGTVTNGGISASAIGDIRLQASQEGNWDYRPAALEQKTIQILPAPVNVSVVPSSTQVTAPGMISVNVPVTWSGSGAVAGTVNLRDGGSEIDAASLNAAGVATFSNLQLPVGNHALTASYAQQGNFAAGISDPVSVTVSYPPADLQITPSSSEGSVSAGQQITFSLKLEPSLGFTPTVSLSCEGLPLLSSCQFSQNSISVGAGGSTVSVTISTTGPHQGQNTAAVRRPTNTHTRSLPYALAGAFWIGNFAAGLLSCFRKRSARGRSNLSAGIFVLTGLLLIPAIFLSGCGTHAPSTRLGTSTITVTALAVQGASTVARQTSFQLDVTK